MDNPLSNSLKEMPCCAAGQGYVSGSGQIRRTINAPRQRWNITIQAT
jgi:hypothetical protein